jgi:toxin ParE1/3/4
LSNEAVRHVEAIYEFTVERFGEYQAEAYVAGLSRTFGLLADFPLIGTAAFELAPSVRRFRYQAHYIFYAPADDFILVRAIVHTKRDIRRDMLEE